MKCLFVIPAYNTQSSLLNVLLELRTYCDNDILVVDDGSTPDLHIGNNSSSSIFLIKNTNNKGKGYSLKKAIKYALNNSYTHIVTIDSDLQHNPSYINKFINAGDYIDIVFGQRSFKSPMPIHRILSNKITSKLLSLLIKNKVQDSQCGYRRYRLEIFNNKELFEDGYQFESEVLLKCLNGNSSIYHINIETLYPDNNKSYMNNRKDTYKFIKLILRHIFA